MEQPELMPLQPPTPLPRPGITGRALGALFFVLALLVSGFGLYNAAHAAGVVGVHGTLAVERCWVDQGGRNSRGTTVCGGTFRSDDGRVVNDRASVRAAGKPGGKVSVQQAGDGYVRVGFGVASRWAGLFFLGWLVAAFGVAFAATGMFPRDRVQVAMVQRAVSGTRVRAVRRWLALGGLAGAAVCVLPTLPAQLLG
ncbi:hypothetical protein OK074_4313 [Actinobacteria bacterium OK074]|nr:hypothetical protein OK074_4313 [Actinobacteria bacterium OK074]